MKVLHITNNYPTEKLPIFGIFVKEQIESLKDLGVDNEVFFVNGYEKGKLEYLKSIFRLRRYLKSRRFDVIHCHHALSALMFMLSFKSLGTKAIVSFQNDPIHEHGLPLFYFLKLRFSSFIFKNRSELIEKLNGKGYYLPNGVNSDFFCPMDKVEAKKAIGLNENKKYILFISSFVVRKQKRLDRYDDVITFLKSQFPEENYEELKLVNVERKFMPTYFNAASLHLLTSDFEGSPNSVKESICCNTPVVSTNVGNVKEMLLNAKNCFVSDDPNPEVLAKLVQKAIHTEFDLRPLIFDQELDKKSVATKLFSIYSNLVSKA
jgi:glycosyltransferase involved in cell wall biosynthesis